ncbi:MAG: YceI family protein [Deltaproteobacteria bacterium]|nr:YceI family protein [Deltaproteobacteria bacterium]
MRSFFLSVLSIAALAAWPAHADTPFTGKTGALKFASNAADSKVSFFSDAPMEKIKGRADGTATGEVNVPDATNLATASGRFSVPVAKIETGNGMRDKHLQGPDWLNASANPNITFEFSKVDIAKVEGNRAKGRAHGKFSVNGKAVDKDIAVDIAYAPDKNMIKVTASFKVALADHAVKGSAGTVGSKVGASIDVDVTVICAAR